MPIALTALSEASDVFARSKAGVVGSNPARGMHVCAFIPCLCCPVYMQRPCIGLIPRYMIPTVYRIED
jgi:hypothetical protein